MPEKNWSSERRNEMDNYPEVVALIVNDYLERVKSHLRLLPPKEQEEFLQELRSHLYEAYQQTPGDDDVARMLALLRNFGEPAEVVADRLPDAMVRSGARRNLPLYALIGMLIALFGIPLGFGGMGVLAGLLAALAAIVIAYYATAGSILLAGVVSMSAGMTRLLVPSLWDKMIAHGFLQMNGGFGDFLEGLPPSLEALIILLFGSAMVAGGLGMLRAGKHMLRGLRFLMTLAFDWTRRFAQNVRRRLRRPAPAVRFTANQAATS
jgi:uncharacterized membrane protein